MIFPFPILIRFAYVFFRVLLPPTLNRPRSGYFCFRESVQKNLNAWTIRVISAYIYKYLYIYLFLPLSSKSTVTLTVELRAMEQGTFEQPSMFR